MTEINVKISLIKNYIRVEVFEESKELSRKCIDINEGQASAIDQTICVLGNTITDIVEALKNEIKSTARLKQIFVIKDNNTVASFNFACNEEVQNFIDSKFTKLNKNESVSHYYSDPYFITIKDKGIHFDMYYNKNIVVDPTAIKQLLSNYC